MKKIIIPLIFMMIAAIPKFGQPTGKKSDKDGKEKEQLIELANQFTNAVNKKDTSILENILSDDYGDVGLFSGLVTPKSLVIRAFKEKIALESVNLDLKASSGASIRFFDKTAVMIVPAEIIWSGANKTKYLATLVAVKQNGHWQFVSTHYSEIRVQVSPR
jgi:hypothetical protein